MMKGVNDSELQQTKVQLEGPVAVITLFRPKKMNSFTQRMARELVHLFEAASKDDTVRCVVVTGEGSAFCAGADLTSGSFPTDKESREKTGMASIQAHRDEGGQVALSIMQCRKPVIAAINGSAVGIGITMTMAMDIRVAAEDAKIGFVFGRRGIIPEACSSYILPRIIGISKACELIYTGRIFPAKDEPQLFNHIVPASQVLSKAMSIADEITKCAPSSVTFSKAMLWQGLTLRGPEEAHFLESKIISWCFTESPDTKEGVMSFLEKRPAEWKVSPWSGMPPVYPFWNSPDTVPPLSKL